MRVFLSSVITGMEEFRSAAAAGIGSLGHQVSRAEDFGASSQSPQQACLAGVRAADAVVLLLGGRYGATQDSGLSATHEEYREARERCDVLVFVQQGIELEPGQKAFVREAQDWSAGQYTEPFRTAEELRDLVTRRLHELELAKQAGPADDEEMLARVLAILPERGEAYRDSLVVAVTGGPRQQILRPVQIEDEALHRKLMRDALFGETAIFVPGEGTNPSVERQVLRIAQERASVAIDGQGSICILQPATSQSGRMMLSTLVQEEILQKIENALRFAGRILDDIDGPRRLSDVVPVAALLNAGFMPWKTQQEYEREPNSATMSGATDRVVVHLTPASRKRAGLLNTSRELAEDLMVLLRRELRSH